MNVENFPITSVCKKLSLAFIIMSCMTKFTDTIHSSHLSRLPVFPRVDNEYSVRHKKWSSFGVSGVMQFFLSQQLKNDAPWPAQRKGTKRNQFEANRAIHLQFPEINFVFTPRLVELDLLLHFKSTLMLMHAIMCTVKSHDDTLLTNLYFIKFHPLLSFVCLQP